MAIQLQAQERHTTRRKLASAREQEKNTMMRLSEAKQQREEFEARMRENTLELERLRGQLAGTSNDDELTPRSSSNTRRKLQDLKEERDRLQKEGRTLDNKVARLQAERQKVRCQAFSPSWPG